MYLPPYVHDRPALNVLEKLPIFLCCNSKSYLFCLLPVPISLNIAHTLGTSYLCDSVTWLEKSWRYEDTLFAHGNRMAPCVFLQVPSALGIQTAKNRCYTGASVGKFHLVLPFYNGMRVVTSDYTISLWNVTVPPDFLPTFPALRCLI